MFSIGLCLSFYILSYSQASFFSGCVEPPMECPNINITFWLYTRSNKENPTEIRAYDSDTIKSAPWVSGAPIKILVHGYTGHKDFSPNTEIRPAYLHKYDYNIISVDYNPIAREPCYVQAAVNTELVGKCTAQLIDVLVTEYDVPLELFHIVGFSLGGQIAGYVGNYLNSGRLTRITGLDPALPMFATQDANRKLDVSDANFIDVLHTNALLKGKLEACGHIDFYANGGLTQPGCVGNGTQSKSGCDHARAPLFFAESIVTDVGFYGIRCVSWITYMIGWCEMSNEQEEVLFGEYVTYGLKGLYFFQTNPKSPYARGPHKRSVTSSEETENHI